MKAMIWDVQSAARLARLIPLLPESVAIARENRTRFAPVGRAGCGREKVRARRTLSAEILPGISGREVQALGIRVATHCLRRPTDVPAVSRLRSSHPFVEIASKVLVARQGYWLQPKSARGEAGSVRLKARSSTLVVPQTTARTGRKAHVPIVGRVQVTGADPMDGRSTHDDTVIGILRGGHTRRLSAQQSFAPRRVNASVDRLMGVVNHDVEPMFHRRSVQLRQDELTPQDGAGGHGKADSLDRVSVRRVLASRLIRDSKMPSFSDALDQYFSRQMRVPPSGMTGYDPRLSPSWAGLQIPG